MIGRIFSFQRSAVPWAFFTGGIAVALFTGLAGHTDPAGLRVQTQQFLIPTVIVLIALGAFVTIFRGEAQGEASLGITLSDMVVTAVLWGGPLVVGLVTLAQWWQGRPCFPPPEITNFSIVFALAGAGFAVCFHGVRVPLMLWHKWPPLRYGTILLLAFWVVYTGPAFVARVSADLTVREDRRRRLEFYRKQTGTDPEDAGTGFVQGLYGFDVPPFSLATDLRGNITAAGGFQWYGGMPAPGLLRLTSDGHFDESFPRFPDFPVLFSRPRVLVALSGNTYVNVGLSGGSPPTRILPNGQIDAQFAQVVGDPAHPPYSPDHMVFQSDGRLVFSNEVRFVGMAPMAIVRLKPSGLIDEEFTQRANADLEARWGAARCSVVGVGSDGRVFALVEKSSGAPVGRLVAFNPDGSLDATFTPPEDLAIRNFRCAPDDALYIVATPGPGTPAGLMRLLENGRTDPSFGPPAYGTLVKDLEVQKDGKVLALGRLKNAVGHPAGLVRFLPDGRFDPAFLPNRDSHGISPVLTAVQVGEDGKILVAGQFTTMQYLFGRRVFTFMRLDEDGRRDPSFVLP